MHFLLATALALAISSNAAPHFPPSKKYGYDTIPAAGAGAGAGTSTGISFTIATGAVSFPTSTGLISDSSVVYRDAADGGDGDDTKDEDENEDEGEGEDEGEDEDEDEDEVANAGGDGEADTDADEDDNDDDDADADADAGSDSDKDSEDEASSSSSPASTGSASATASSVATTSATAPSTTEAADIGDAASGGSLPASSGTSVLKAVQTIAAGKSFDGGMVMFDRGVSCTGQAEGGDSDAVFELEDGATLSNVIIGPNQIEGVHCFGACTLKNVWWSAVCEDAFTIKKQDAGSTTTITGGGAFGADDKVFQHNGAGTLSVSGFTVKTFGKLYRSCGNCDSMYERHVILNDITASDGKILAGINSNYKDTATLTNIKASTVKEICTEFEGNDTGAEPKEVNSGPSGACKYSESDVSS